MPWTEELPLTFLNASAERLFLTCHWAKVNLNTNAKKGWTLSVQDTSKINPCDSNHLLIHAFMFSQLLRCHICHFCFQKRSFLFCRERKNSAPGIARSMMMPFLVSLSFLQTSEPQHMDYKISGTVSLKNCSALDFHTLKPLFFFPYTLLNKVTYL